MSLRHPVPEYIDCEYRFSVVLKIFVTTIGFWSFAWDLGMTLESITERSQSRLKFMIELI